jgi:hypothetical protein
MTFINDPHYGSSSIEFDINGLIASAVSKTTNLQKHPHLSLSCGGASKMLLLLLDQDVFNSALEVYFKVTATLDIGYHFSRMSLCSTIICCSFFLNLFVACLLHKLLFGFRQVQCTGLLTKSLINLY